MRWAIVWYYQTKLLIIERMTISHVFARLKQGSGRLVLAALALVLVSVAPMQSSARPVTGGKGAKAQPQRFFRQSNTYSNMQFFVTNRGVLFNRDAVAGLYWPRGTSNSYIFGGGVWFTTKKVIAGRRQKLAEIGYNPNSGAGWFIEGEVDPPDDGASADSKYITYFSPKYDRYTGKYIGGADPGVPPPAYNWPIWDTAVDRQLKRNFYFGDYISNTGDRTVEKLSIPGKKEAQPAILSQEDIVNIYTDIDITQNPEFKPNRGYPFNLDIQEIIYSWSFGRYRDMIFVRHRIKNSSDETLYDCYVAPAFDPDLGPNGANSARNDRNSYLSTKHIQPADTNVAKRALREADYQNRFGGQLENLNMAFQSSEREDSKNYGMIGFAFLESPVVDGEGNIIENSDPAALGQPQLGLHTFKKWNISNDPPTQDLRYDFVSAGTRDGDTGPADVRLLFSTGPFTLPPGKFVETVVGIGIAHVSTTSDQPNLDSLIRLMVNAHYVFAEEKRDTAGVVTEVTHFQSPEPPSLPNLVAKGLDRAVLLTWDSTAERSIDRQGASEPFIGYELWRSTRSDLDSTIRPDGKNPVIRLARWSKYDYKVEDIYENNKFVGKRYTRLSNIENPIPHSFLDVGDDNKDGQITGSEGLINGVRYYYYLVAFDEFDSVNNIGPLTTAIVKDINFTSAIPTKPPFLTHTMNLESVLKDNCLANGGIDTVQLALVDTGRFQALYTNDTIAVSVQPRWVELSLPQFQGRLDYYFDVTDTRQGRSLTYDELYDPNASPVVSPYGEYTGLTSRVVGQESDSSWKKRFTTDQVNFAPNQTIDQTFRVLVDYNMTKLVAPYKLESVKVEGADKNIVRLSARTLNERIRTAPVNLEALAPEDTRPHFAGALGENEYEITFGDFVDMREMEFDTTAKKDTLYTSLEGEGAGVFRPRVLPITITSKEHCNAKLHLIRDGRVNDIYKALLVEFYNDTVLDANENPFPANTDPDTMLVPIPGHFAVDAWHFSYDKGGSPADGVLFKKTVGAYYYPLGGPGTTDNGANKSLATVHRIRVAGAELILNAPGITGKSIVGDESPASDPTSNDFGPGDKITVKFTGLAKDMPFPDTAFYIYTADGAGVKFTDANLYRESVLEQVQVVPNPYVVTHLGQTSTDNAKLYFTRLPPRATIEIYNLAGDLIKTLEHNAYTTNNQGELDLQNNSTMLEWNLLSEGRQRIGSQVLIARIIAKDHTGAVIDETTKKFAVVIGGYRIVR